MRIDAPFVSPQDFRSAQRLLPFSSPSESHVNAGEIELHLGRVRIEFRCSLQCLERLFIAPGNAMQEADLKHGLRILRHHLYGFVKMGESAVQVAFLAVNESQFLVRRGEVRIEFQRRHVRIARQSRAVPVGVGEPQIVVGSRVSRRQSDGFAKGCDSRIRVTVLGSGERPGEMHSAFDVVQLRVCRRHGDCLFDRASSVGKLAESEIAAGEVLMCLTFGIAIRVLAIRVVLSDRHLEAFDRRGVFTP